METKTEKLVLQGPKMVKDETEFYQVYFNLLNLYRSRTYRLTPREIELLSLLCAKPMNFILDSEKSGNGKSKKYILASDMKVSPPAVYPLIKNLNKKKILILSEDGFYNVPDNVNSLRRVIKEKLSQGNFNFDYIFNFILVNDQPG